MASQNKRRLKEKIKRSVRRKLFPLLPTETALPESPLEEARIQKPPPVRRQAKTRPAA